MLKEMVKDRKISDLEDLPVKAFEESETRKTFPSVKHSWMDKGKVLLIGENEEKDCEQMMELFKQVWTRGQPVVMDKSWEKWDKSRWSPKFFQEKFSDVSVDCVDVLTEEKIRLNKMSTFWDGFFNAKDRRRDDEEEDKSKETSSDSCSNLVLRLESWPLQSEEFSDTLPGHLSDIMKNIPMPSYTLKNGSKNLATLLPDVFVRPDLGPRTIFIQGLGAKMAKDNCSVNLHEEAADSVTLLLSASAR